MLCIPDQLWIRSILSGNALRSACPFEAQLIRQADAEGSALSLTLLERGSSPTLPRMPNALTQHGPRPRGVSTIAAPTGAPCRLRRHRLAGWPRMARPRAGEPSRRLGQKDGFDPGEKDPPFRQCPLALRVISLRCGIWSTIG